MMSIPDPIESIRPAFVSIAQARLISGLSRSEIYRRLDAGDISAKKAGSRTLIILESLIAFLQSLPQADFRGTRAKKRAAHVR
jgi:hypothetical protein